MKISEIITDKYKLRIPPTVYYDLLADVQEAEEEQQPILDKINKMKSEIADSLEFWDYSPNNNPLARDMLETLTNFWGDIREVEE